ncbi:MAG: MFS transporter, partial [Dehalococcoidia bacterium]
MKLDHVYYGWIIVCVSAGIMAVCSIPVHSFGLFLEPLIRDFGWGRGPLSLAPSIAYVLAGCLGVVTGKLSDKHGARIFVSLGGILMGAGFVLMSRASTLRDTYVFWGLFMGLAIGCFISPIFSTIPRWFAQRRGMAVSIMAIGFGVGAIASPLLVHTLISAHGWQQACIILGVVVWAIVLPLAQFLKTSPAQMGCKLHGGSVDTESQAMGVSIQQLSLAEAVRGIPFWLYSTIQLLWSFCIQAIVVHIVPHAIASGIMEIAAASILSVIAGFSVISRVVMVFVSDKSGARQLLGLCLILSTMAFIWLIFARGVLAFYVFAIFLGLSYGGVMPLMTLVPSELFGTKSLGAIIGILMVYATIGGAGGSPFAGYVFDMTGSYRVALPILAAMSMIAALLGVGLWKYRG